MEYPLLFGFIFGLILLSGWSYVTYLQFHEVLRPKSPVTNIRWGLFIVLMLTIITLVPSVIYQYLLLVGHPSEGLLNFVRVMSRLNGILTLLILIYIYRYKQRD